MIRKPMLWATGLVLCLSGAAYGAGDGKATLRAPEVFREIADPQARGRAMFLELGKVIQHPRCMNCHPRGDSPTQTQVMRLHQPQVVRGKDGHGVAALPCGACHRDANFEPARVPGAPHWALAPRSMGWQGQSLGNICRQIKDPRRNGSRTFAQLIDHMTNDKLVGWAWNPGGGREPAPGTQQHFGALFKAWAKGGAQCPK